MSTDSSASNENIPSISQMEEEEISSEEPPMSQWSSLEDSVQENKKRTLQAIGLYTPGSGEICNKYIAMSDMDITKTEHPYYIYPAVHDPGIKKAIFAPERPLIYTDDGQKLYLAVCAEMNICPIRLFHIHLQNDEINLSYYGVNPRGVRAIAMALQYNKYVRRLILTDNFLNDDACYHLNQMLQSNVTLDELILAGCRVGASGTKRLVAKICFNRTLKMLNLAGNNICDEGGILVANEIEKGCTIKRLNLSNNQLGRQTAMAFAQAFTRNNTITNLDLSCNNFIHVPSTVKMLQELGASKFLEELNLSWNTLESERVGNVIKNIMLVPNLTILDLSHNKFEGEAVSAIASALPKAKKLVTIDLSFNPLSPGDAYNLLQKMLRPRVKLVNLLMEDVRVGIAFPVLLDRVRHMTCRKNFLIQYGSIVKNWIIHDPDTRELILRRADYLGNSAKKDIPLFFLKMSEENPKPITSKDFVQGIRNEGLPLDLDLLNEFPKIFPGPKFETVDLQSVCDYIHRLWPEKKLPLTPLPPPSPPPPEQETELDTMMSNDK